MRIFRVYIVFFDPKKVNIDLFQEAKPTIIRLISITSLGPTPFLSFILFEFTFIHGRKKIGRNAS
jgi:hypothetical protein